MPRMARVKTEQSIFHIMCKSISEVQLFKDSDDKEKYLSLVKKYKELYNFKIYGYCIMNNHSHLIIDANGSDISRVMHGINFSYAMYFNRKYEREGHLFKDRFKSKIVDNDRYLMTLSLYIHNNPNDICEYKNCPEKYAFSSLSTFLGKRRDSFRLVDYGFVLKLFGSCIKIARKNYYNLIFVNNEENLNEESELKDEINLKEDFEFKDEKTEYKNERKIIIRNFKPDDVVEFVSQKMNISKTKIRMKYSRNLVEPKALIVVLMRSLCNFKSKEICKILGNITQARVSKLSSIGINFIDTKEKHKNIIEEFINCYS
ncbi:transposase [Clostridium lacusfryxellense]|uniref:transposase n=1 Tax=Clostridium lacusfryxellense TaxID=205328 RepID=UPI001C0D8FF3|nr:transposase [Clostridium lacusfryxellense]MBU3110373.1 transposase [Clostridium lacusfryxellense]